MLFTGCLKQSQALPFIYLLCMENTFCDQCMLIRNLIGLAYSDFPQESIIISSKSNIHHFNMWEIPELAHRGKNCQNTFFEIPAFWLINKPNYISLKVQNIFFMFTKKTSGIHRILKTSVKKNFYQAEKLYTNGVFIKKKELKWNTSFYLLILQFIDIHLSKLSRLLDSSLLRLDCACLARMCSPSLKCPGSDFLPALWTPHGSFVSMSDR